MPGVKRRVGYGAQGPGHAPHHHGGGVHRKTVVAGQQREGEVVTVLRSVEASLEGDVHVLVRPFPARTSTAMSPRGLEDSLAALVREIASNSESNRSIQITVTQRELGHGSASAAGVLRGPYVVFEIDDDRSAGRHAGAGVLPLDPGIGLAAARDAVVGAGGFIGLSHCRTGGERFTAFVPARPPSRLAADGSATRTDADGPSVRSAAPGSGGART